MKSHFSNNSANSYNHNTKNKELKKIKKCCFEWTKYCILYQHSWGFKSNCWNM